MELSDGCGKLALRACEENFPRLGGRYRHAGRIAVNLPGSRRNRLPDHDGNHALQGLAAVRGRTSRLTGQDARWDYMSADAARGCPSLRPARSMVYAELCAVHR